MIPEENEYSLGSMFKSFYNRKMLPVVILVWFWFLLILAVGIYCGVKYYHSDNLKELIIYAAVIVICAQFVALLKNFGYGFIHANRIHRRIDKLQQHISELTSKTGNRRL